MDDGALTTAAGPGVRRGSYSEPTIEGVGGSLRGPAAEQEHPSLASRRSQTEPALSTAAAAEAAGRGGGKIKRQVSQPDYDGVDRGADRSRSRSAPQTELSKDLNVVEEMALQREEQRRASIAGGGNGDPHGSKHGLAFTLIHSIGKLFGGAKARRAGAGADGDGDGGGRDGDGDGGGVRRKRSSLMEGMKGFATKLKNKGRSTLHRNDTSGPRFATLSSIPQQTAEELERFAREVADPGVQGQSKTGVLGHFAPDGTPLAAGEQREGNRLPRFMISEHSKRRGALDVVLCLLIVWHIFAIPARLAFGQNGLNSDTNFLMITGGWAAWDVVVDCFFLVDVALVFRTAVVAHKRGVIEVKPVILARNYIQSWFAVDLAASFPFSFFVVAGAGWFPGPSGWRVLNMLRFLRLPRIIKRFSGHEVNIKLSQLAFLRLFKIAVTLFIVWHMIACLYWTIAVYEGLCAWDAEEEGYREQPSAFRQWATATSGLATNANGFYACGDAWTPWAALVESQAWTQYVQALFWAVVVTTGVGKDIVPQTNLETLFTCGCIVVGAVFYAIIIGSLSSALSNLDSTNAIRHRKIESIELYMRHAGVPGYLRRAIMGYYDYVWACSRQNIGDLDLFKELPASLRLRLKVALRHKRVVEIPLFQYLPAPCLIALISEMTSTIALPGEYIVKSGTYGEKMYIVDHGQAQVLLTRDVETAGGAVSGKTDSDSDDDDKDHEHSTGEKPDHMSYYGSQRREKVIDVMTSGAFFGESALYGKPRNASVRALQYCELLVLHARRVLQISESFPELAARFKILR